MPSSDQPKPNTRIAGDADTAETAPSSVPAQDGLASSIGSGLLAKQPTPDAEEHVTVAKVCPQCGNEYQTGDRFCPRDGAPLKPKSGGDPMIGRVIADRYLILARLGEGGMGRVYAAEHVKMNRQCAIKVMSPSLMNDAESTTRFAREASNAARILHPNVAAVFDFGESDKTVYLVMEYVDGESLSQLLAREGPLAPRRAIDIARQIADGLSAAHELGLVHRDLKPDNVIVTRKRDGKEVAKVVDFGIAKAVSDSPQDALTRSGLVIGTPEFMSPEQLLGDPVDARTDIYSLGCMLYQMLTGLKPFEADSREQMIRRRLHEPPPHARDVVQSIPKRVDTLLAHMLARAPGERIASASEVSTSLDPALVMSGWDLEAVSGHAPTRSGRGAPTVTRQAADLGMQPTMPMKIERPSAGRVAVGTLLGSVALFAGLLVWRERQADNAGAASLPAAVAHSRADSTAVIQAPKDTSQAGLAKARVVDTSRPAAASITATAPKRAAHDTSGKTAHKSNKSASASPKAPPPPVQNPDETAIHDVLEHLAISMGNGDVAIRNAFAGTPAPLLDNLQQIFANADHVRATLQEGTPSISGDHAEVPFNVQFQFNRHGSPLPEGAKQSYSAALQRRNGQWELTSLVQRPLTPSSR
ncbi:MAG: protein kinase domain-containing protein [Gemmatimonadaceae bacterium]